MVGLTGFEPATPGPLGISHPGGSRGVIKVVEHSRGQHAGGFELGFDAVQPVQSVDPCVTPAAACVPQSLLEPCLVLLVEYGAYKWLTSRSCCRLRSASCTMARVRRRDQVRNINGRDLRMLHRIPTLPYGKHGTEADRQDQNDNREENSNLPPHGEYEPTGQ